MRPERATAKSAASARRLRADRGRDGSQASGGDSPVSFGPRAAPACARDGRTARYRGACPASRLRGPAGLAAHSLALEPAEADLRDGAGFRRGAVCMSPMPAPIRSVAENGACSRQLRITEKRIGALRRTGGLSARQRVDSGRTEGRRKGDANSRNSIVKSAAKKVKNLSSTGRPALHPRMGATEHHRRRTVGAGTHAGARDRNTGRFRSECAVAERPAFQETPAFHWSASYLTRPAACR